MFQKFGQNISYITIIIYNIYLHDIANGFNDAFIMCSSYTSIKFKISIIMIKTNSG